MIKTIAFKDAEGMCQVTFDNEGCAGRAYIGFQGNRNGSGGQIEVTPNIDSKWQKDLVLFWEHLHLKEQDTIEAWSEQDKMDIAKKLNMEFGNFTWDGVCNMISSVMSKIEEEDKTRRIQDYAEQKTDLDENDEKKLALIQLLGEEPESIVDIEEEDCNEYSLNGETYLIVTDSEADEAFDESVDNYIDDAMEIPKHLMQYIDREAIKQDCDRGSQLSYYDGNEQEETINGTTYYLYQR